jgi:hypothetical protein
VAASIDVLEVNNEERRAARRPDRDGSLTSHTGLPNRELPGFASARGRQGATRGCGVAYERSRAPDLAIESGFS